MIRVTFSDNQVFTFESEHDAGNWLSHSQEVKKSQITKDGDNWSVDRATKVRKPKKSTTPLDPDAVKRAAGW